MLDRLRALWAERPAVVAAAVIAPVAFFLTLLILFLVVGNGQQSPQQDVVAEQQASEQQADEAQTSTTQEATVVVDTSSDDAQQQEAVEAEQETTSAADEEEAVQQTSESQDAESEQTSSQQADESEDSQAEEEASPQTVAGFTVEPLEQALAEEIDEDALRHGTDGMEGGILPIDNGVVVSSNAEQRTTWELLVPSASLKSAIVRVGRTSTGAMGSPDNPYVIGWLDSSAEPGAVGNLLLAGHRDFEDKDGNVGTGVCWELVNTVVGDQMIVRDNENEIYYIYTVTEAATVDPKDRSSRKYLRNSDERIITLITCEGSFNAETHQYSHRRVVVGVLAAVASPDA